MYNYIHLVVAKDIMSGKQRILGAYYDLEKAEKRQNEEITNISIFEILEIDLLEVK